VTDAVSNFDHWMRFNVGDYLADTMHLSTFQHGMYVLLIMHYFKRGGLPEDEAALRLITKCPVRQWRSQSAPVMSLFRRETGAYTHPRIDSTRNEAQRVSEARAKAGKQGASARWGMANARPADGNCHSADMASLAGARAPQPEPEIESPPVTPRKRGVRGRAQSNGGGKKESRNAACDIGAEMFRDRENDDADADDTHSGGARVAYLAGHPRRR
jgi:uncharacterized protein YdaU (DUF1376 family)